MKIQRQFGKKRNFNTRNFFTFKVINTYEESST